MHEAPLHHPIANGTDSWAVYRSDIERKHASHSEPSYRSHAELAAIQFVLTVLIASHPNKRELLGQFDKLAVRHQIAALTMGGRGTPPLLRKTLVKYRKIIEQSL